METRKSTMGARSLTVTALLTALIWLLTLTPIGFTIPFFGISMTFVHIPMIVGMLVEGLDVGMVLGGMFGFASLYKNLTQPTSIYSPMLQNPLVSVVPRLLIVPASYCVLLLMRKLFPDKRKLHCIVAAVSAAVANTVFTLSAFSILHTINPGAFDPAMSVGGIWLLAANLPIEAFSAAIISVAVVAALDKVPKKA